MSGVWSPRTARLTRSAYALLMRHAQSVPTAEVCGLIGGRRGVMQTTYPVANIAHDLRRRFLMDGRGQLDAMRQMSERGESWLAIYHSHVKAPALPSPVDLDLHAYPDAMCVIVAPGMPQSRRVRVFSVRRGVARELPLKIVAARYTSRVSILQQH